MNKMKVASLLKQLIQAKKRRTETAHAADAALMAAGQAERAVIEIMDALQAEGQTVLNQEKK